MIFVIWPREICASTPISGRIEEFVMLISLNWMKDFVDIPSTCSGRELADQLTLSVCEVEKVIESGGCLGQVQVICVQKVEPHPQADKLHLVTFDNGGTKPLKVVCGAGNVRAGLKTLFAPCGTVLADGTKLEPKKIRGVLSEGMLCSSRELGLGEDSEGLLELSEDARPGESYLEHAGSREDILFDIDNKSLTHRPDLWGHYGMARELAAIFKTPLKKKMGASSEGFMLGENSPVKVSVGGRSAGLVYYGLSLDGISVEESPPWMQERLSSLGHRPINSIVDISNYVMLETGIPNHIFDRDKIGGDTICVKALEGTQSFVTLDGVERSLEKGDTVVCGGDEPLVIGGIMGGEKSGVTEKTGRIFIEVANWKARDVRRTSTRLGLRTESSQRYEKSLDSRLCEGVLYRIVELILQLNPKSKIVGKVERGGEEVNPHKPKVIRTNMARMERVLGTELEDREILDIFHHLGFAVDLKNEGTWAVTVPSWRATKDIGQEADLFEEVGRHIRYDSIRPCPPKLEVAPVRLGHELALARRLRSFLVDHTGAHEVMNYPLLGDNLLEKSHWPKEGVLTLKHPISRDHQHMRPSLIPTLLETAAHNAKHFSQFRFFEYGRSYLPGKGKNFSDEQYHLGVVFADRHKSVFVDILDHVTSLIQATRIPAKIMDRHPKFKNELVSEDWIGVHPYEFKNIQVQGKMKGFISSIHPFLLGKWKVKGHLSMAIIDLTTFHGRALDKKKVFKPLPKFPGSHFDYTVTIDCGDSVGKIFTVLESLRIKEVTGHKIVDIYKDKSEKHVTMRTSFLDQEKSLSGEFLKGAEERIVACLAEDGIHLKKGDG